MACVHGSVRSLVSLPRSTTTRLCVARSQRRHTNPPRKSQEFVASKARGPVLADLVLVQDYQRAQVTTMVTSRCTHRQHQHDSTTPRVCLRALLIDCRRRRCLNARRAASSFSESRIQRATTVVPDVDDRDMSDPTDVASDADDSVRRTHERGRPCARRRREPCSPFVDVLREAHVLVRGT
jgi:hypothetical protein